MVVKLRFIHSHANIPLVNVTTYTERLTDELLEFLEWLLATNNLYCQLL